jgi:hypothetical protein
MTPSRFISFALVATATAPSPGLSMEFATNMAHLLETAYIADCVTDTSPHGFYGAIFQPCEFTFRQLNNSYTTLPSEEEQDMCSDKVSTVLASATPMSWLFNLTEHMDKDDWDEIDIDDFDEVADKLLLWPDQCVGVQARCYSIEIVETRETLNRIFVNKIPKGATHVHVNCQNDAVALSRFVYAFADGFEKSMPTIIFWSVTVVLFSLVASLWCCFACIRLCQRCGETRTHSTGTFVVSPKMKHRDYMSIEDLKEVELLVQK